MQIYVSQVGYRLVKKCVPILDHETAMISKGYSIKEKLNSGIIVVIQITLFATK
jgi:hypothetical protein